MKVLHLEHPEDMILEGDLSVFDSLYGTANISLKIDGCPAIVYGTNPENGKFFVGTKSVFNKKKKMICYTVEDIFNLYNEETHSSLIEVLVMCLMYLPKVDGIIQGDFIGFGGSNVYRPNTLTYTFPEIISQKIIIAPHTFYKTDTTLLDAIASPLITVFTDTDDVKYVQPTVDRVFEYNEVPKINTDKVTFMTAKEAKIAKQAVNNLIRDGVDLDDSALYDIFGCNHLVNLYQIVRDIKVDLMNSMIVTDAPKCYNDGIEIVGEGFVFQTKYGTIKLVNREEFAFANFNNGRFQK